MDDADRARISAELIGSFAQIVHRTAKDAAAILRRDGLNPAQFQLLRAVAESPGMSQSTLGLRRGVTAGSVSQLVSKLEALGLVRREADGAANRLWLTDRGQELVSRLVPDQDLFFIRRFAGTDDADLQALRDLTVRALMNLPDSN